MCDPPELVGHRQYVALISNSAHGVHSLIEWTVSEAKLSHRVDVQQDRKCRGNNGHFRVDI